MLPEQIQVGEGQGVELGRGRGCGTVGLGVFGLEVWLGCVQRVWGGLLPEEMEDEEGQGVLVGLGELTDGLVHL